MQTRRFDSITSQFDTRTIVLIPIAIALNIILGQAVAAALKMPIYLDSIGTILVGVLAGPLAGALTGLLSNVLWTFVCRRRFTATTRPRSPSSRWSSACWPARSRGSAGCARGRPPTRRGWRSAASPPIAVIVVLALARVHRLAGDRQRDLVHPDQRQIRCSSSWAVVALLIVVGTIVGLAALLFVRRDLTAAYVVVAGVITGIVAAIISAPISANLFGGVTGAGTDFLVAAFRQAGADIQAATLGQGLISDPIDKVVTFVVVYVILGAMAVRTKARFPQGERLVNVEGAA